jgi:hypothetical protein
MIDGTRVSAGEKEHDGLAARRVEAINRPD